MTKHTRYNFPSGEMDEFSLSTLERKYVPVRSQKNRMRKESELRNKAILAAIVIAALFIGLTIEKYVIDPMLVPEKAEAAEIEPIHQNDWYCEHIKSGYYPHTLGRQGASIKELCAKWGVDL